MRRAWASLLLGLAATLLLAAPSQADDLRFGVVTPNRVLNMSVMQQGKVGMVRMNFSWKGIEPREGGAYQWAGHDAAVREAAARGIPVLPTILISPSWVSSDPRNAPSSSSDLARYDKFVKALVGRYGPNGNFWCRNNPGFGCSQAYLPITDWQAWNEPNIDVWWGSGGADGKEYAKFLQRTEADVHSVDPNATIVMAGMPVTAPRGLSQREFLNQFYSVSGIKDDFDVMTAHPYGKDEQAVHGVLTALRDQLASKGDAARRLWITEVGWATDGPDSDPYIKSETGQANKLRKTFQMFVDRRETYKLDTVFWFDWNDVPPSGKEHWYDNTGLFRENGSAKPAWPEFVKFTGGAP